MADLEIQHVLIFFFFTLDAFQVFKSYTIWNHPWHKKNVGQEEPDSTENTDKNYHIKFL